MSEIEHRTTVGYRTIRRLDDSRPQMPFARCRCGWNGPSRRSDSDALKDGTAHMEQTAPPTPLPEPPLLGLAGEVYMANPHYRLDGDNRRDAVTEWREELGYDPITGEVL